MIFDCCNKALGLDPSIIFHTLLDVGTFRCITGMQIGLAHTVYRLRQELQHQAACTPADTIARDAFCHGKTHNRRDLFRLQKILMRCLFKPLPVKRHDTLIAREISALINRQSEMPATQQLRRRCFIRGDGFRHTFCIETRKAAHTVRRIEINHDHIDNTLSARLHLKTAFELQRRAQQNGQRCGFADKARDRRGIAMLGEDAIHRWPQPHDTATAFQRLYDERQHHIIGPEIRDGTRSGFTHFNSPRHQARTPFCA